MTHKERVLRALTHQAVDRLPTQINYTAAMGALLSSHLGVAVADLPRRLDNHLLRVDLSHRGHLSADGLARFDWWGVGWDTQEEGYWPRVSPLAINRDLDQFAWPDPRAASLLDDAARALAADDGEHFIIPNLGFVLFERAWALRGFEQLSIDMMLKPLYVEELLERITEIQLALIHRYIALGVDGGYFGDDYGAQKHLLFSPKLWRQMIKPRLARLFTPFRAAGLPILMHSDGDIAEILPDLVEIGLTTFNPVQPEVIDHAWLRRTFGENLSYYGGVSTQTVLPSGSPAEVKAAAYRCLETLAPNHTGLMLAPSHRMMSDIPMRNVDALLAVFEELAHL
ncbi:MAG TPA: hypothetical protein G4N94_07855 [Caldilineae bacterium]|nr:hypothetical protein [Caldilineae bacterium]